jgi:hypothetical protein
MKSTRLFTVLGALLFPLAVVAVTNGCGNKEEDEALHAAPSAPPVPTPIPTPTPVATITPEEDAGTDAAADAEADADAGKKPAVGGDATGIRKCCAALAQNANSAPPEQKGGYLAAAAACNGLVNSPQGRQALAGLRGLLLGAQLPAACK